MKDICVAGDEGSELDGRQVVMKAWLVSENGWYATLQSEKCPTVLIEAILRKDATLEFVSGEAEPTQEIRQSVVRGMPPLWSFTGTFLGTMKRREGNAQDQPLDGPPRRSDMPYALEISSVTAIRLDEPPPPLRVAPPPPEL